MRHVKNFLRSSNLLNLFSGALLLCLLSGCGITIPNTRVCAVSGLMTAGADCAWTLSDETEEMNLDQLIEFLEPRVATETLPARGAAICQSAEDWNKQKTALEQACKKMGRWCTFEVKAMAESMQARVDALQSKVSAKAQRQRKSK